MSVRAKAYKVTLPIESYTEEDLRKIETWSLENCCRAAIVHTDGEHIARVAIREKARSKGEWMRHVRGVFRPLRLDARPRAASDRWLQLCTTPEASEIIRNANGTTRRGTP